MSVVTVEQKSAFSFKSVPPDRDALMLRKDELDLPAENGTDSLPAIVGNPLNSITRLPVGSIDSSGSQTVDHPANNEPAVQPGFVGRLIAAGKRLFSASN